MSATVEKPDIVEQKHLEFLDHLRETGITNMLGAGSFVKREFPELTEGQASEIVGYWMSSFGDRHQRKV